MTIDFPPRTGGVARYLHQLALQMGEDVCVWASEEEGSEANDNTATYFTKRKSILFRYIWPRWMKAVFLLIKNQKTYQKVVVSHILPLGTAAMLAKMVTKKPYIVILHGMDFRLLQGSPKKKWLGKKVVDHAERLVVNSKALAEEIKAFSGKDPIVFYPCVPAPHKETQTKRANNSVSLLTVSRLVKRKGHLRVLQALKELRDEQPDLMLTYQIIGRGPMQEIIEQTIKKYSLSDTVVLKTDATDDEVESTYQQSDLFVMPVIDDNEDKEGFGIVFLEAALHGIPSISTNISGVDEAIVNGETGVLIDDNDIEALKRTITHLATSQGERTRLGTAAKERAARQFTCEAQFQSIKPHL